MYLCVFVCICVYLCVFVCICVYLCAACARTDLATPYCT